MRLGEADILPIEFAKALAPIAEFNPEKIILFGSHARGNWDEESVLTQG